MNPPRVSAEDYVQFLIAAPKVASAAEAAMCQPEREKAPAHDARARLPHRPEPGPAALWFTFRRVVTTFCRSST